MDYTALLFTQLYKYLDMRSRWLNMILYGMKGDIHSILLKEYITQLRPSHRVSDCLADHLSLRRYSEHTDGPWSRSMKENVVAPELGQIQYGVPNCCVNSFVGTRPGNDLIVCYWLSKYMKWVVGYGIVILFQFWFFLSFILFSLYNMFMFKNRKSLVSISSLGDKTSKMNEKNIYIWLWLSNNWQPTYR